MANNHIMLYLASLILLLGTISSSFYMQGVAAYNLSKQKLTSPILQEEIVKEVNENPNAGWKAALSDRFANATVAEFKRLLGVKPTPKNEYLGVPVVTHDRSLKLPKEFDARTAWSQCTSIGRVLDQGHCGSCWAFGAVDVESLSDRFCVKYNMNISLSVNDLLACCGFLCGEGCNGGYPISAWLYFKHHGVGTEECDPYFDKIGCSHPGCDIYPTPECVRECVNGNQLWHESKHFGASSATESVMTLKTLWQKFTKTDLLRLPLPFTRDYILKRLKLNPHKLNPHKLNPHKLTPHKLKHHDGKFPYLHKHHRQEHGEDGSLR